MNKMNIRFILLFAICTVVILPFQNCKGGFESAQISSDSLDLGSEEIPTDNEPDPTQPVPDTGQTHGLPVVTETSYEPILADRYYLHALFNNIFGPRTDFVDSTKVAINALEHGSACSLHEDYKAYDKTTKKYARVDTMKICDPRGASLLIAQVNPKGTVTRQSLITRACSDLTTNVVTLNYALKRISTDTIPAATQENVVTLFKLFYRSQPEPKPALYDAMLSSLPPQNVTIEDWRSLIYTVCISGHWQIL